MAEELGGRVQKASGATRFEKGDVRVRGSVRAECKTTSKDQYILKLADLQKIQKEALSGGLEVPVMQVEFQGSGRKYAVLSWAWMMDMLGGNVDVHQPEYFVLAKALTLTTSELTKVAAKKMELGHRAWAMKVVFASPHGGKLSFAVTPWETFLSAYREEA